MTTTDPRARLDEIKARAEDPATVSDLVAVCNDARKAHAAVEAVIKRADRWTSLDRPEGDDFHGGFNAGVKFAAGLILRDITAALEGEG